MDVWAQFIERVKSLTTRASQVLRPRSVDCSMLLSSTSEEDSRPFSQNESLQICSAALDEDIKTTDSLSGQSPSITVSPSTPQLRTSRRSPHSVVLMNGSMESVGSDIINLQFETYLEKSPDSTSSTVLSYVCSRYVCVCLLCNYVVCVTVYVYVCMYGMKDCVVP